MGLLNGPCHISAIIAESHLPHSFADWAGRQSLYEVSTFAPSTVDQPFVAGADFGPVRDSIK